MEIFLLLLLVDALGTRPHATSTQISVPAPTRLEGDFFFLCLLVVILMSLGYSLWALCRHFSLGARGEPPAGPAKPTE